MSNRTRTRSKSKQRESGIGSPTPSPQKTPESDSDEEISFPQQIPEGQQQPEEVVEEVEEEESLNNTQEFACSSDSSVSEPEPDEGDIQIMATKSIVTITPYSGHPKGTQYPGPEGMKVELRWGLLTVGNQR